MEFARAMVPCKLPKAETGWLNLEAHRYIGYFANPSYLKLSKTHCLLSESSIGIESAIQRRVNVKVLMLFRE